MTTTRELLEDGIARLRAAGSESPRLDAELLLGHAVGVERTTLIAHPEAPVGTDAARRYAGSIERRAAGEPVAYIRGVKEFFGLALATDARALIPRPETELLVELLEREVVARLTASPRPAGAPPIRVVDVGTGSGAIAVALSVLLHRRAVPAADVDLLATDDSPDALALARENAVGHAVADRVRFVEADLLPAGGPAAEAAAAGPESAGGPEVAARPGPEAPFDVVATNLPYVRTDALAGLPVAASFEPRAALDGGPDGLSVIDRLLDRLPDALAPGGVALLEIGADQGDAIVALVGTRLPGWRCSVRRDLAGDPRVARIERT